MDELIFLPSRIHEEDIPDTPSAIANDHTWEHLNLPCEVDHEAEAIDWFRSKWLTRFLTDMEPVIITSRIYEEGEGKNE